VLLVAEVFKPAVDLKFQIADLLSKERLGLFEKRDVMASVITVDDTLGADWTSVLAVETEISHFLIFMYATHLCLVMQLRG